MNWGEKVPDFLLGRASSPSIVSPPPPPLACGRSFFLSLSVSPPRTYAPERVICRPDLGNRGSVLDLSTRTQDVERRKWMFLCSRGLLAAAIHARRPPIDRHEFAMNLINVRASERAPAGVYFFNPHRFHSRSRGHERIGYRESARTELRVIN